MAIIPVADPTDARLDAFRNIRERDLTGRDGLFVAEGKVVLSVLLRSQWFEPVSIAVLESRLAGLAGMLETAGAQLPVYSVSQSVLDTIAGFHMHRGILAIARRKPALPPSGLMTFGDNALVVVASGISNHDNIGAIFRNAAAFEADALVLDAQCCNPLYRKSIRVSVGAALQVPFEHGGTLETCVKRLADTGFHIAALSPAGTKPVTELPKSGKRALILGSEGHGLPSTMLERLTAWSIPMSNSFDSLNVAAASAIALFHSSRFSQPV